MESYYGHVVPCRPGAGFANSFEKALKPAQKLLSYTGICPILIKQKLCESGNCLQMEITSMNEETFNLSIRKFLKIVGISSQREIEMAVAKAMEEGLIHGNESFPAIMTLEIAGLKLNVKFDGEIKLE